MYRCESCGEQSSPATRLNRIVVETRQASYPCRQKAHWIPKGKTERKGHWAEDPGGTGRQIAREARVCAACAAKAPTAAA